MSEKLRPCPFCGQTPTVSGTYGTQLDLSCCVSMGLQKCDVMTREERDTWDQEIFQYSDEAEEKARNALIDQWNRRAAAPGSFAWAVERMREGKRVIRDGYLGPIFIEKNTIRATGCTDFGNPYLDVSMEDWDATNWRVVEED